MKTTSELRALAAMSDEEIDYSDAASIADWTGAVMTPTMEKAATSRSS